MASQKDPDTASPHLIDLRDADQIANHSASVKGNHPARVRLVPCCFHRGTSCGGLCEAFRQGRFENVVSLMSQSQKCCCLFDMGSVKWNDFYVHRFPCCRMASQLRSCRDCSAACGELFGSFNHKQRVVVLIEDHHIGSPGLRIWFLGNAHSL